MPLPKDPYRLDNRVNFHGGGGGLIGPPVVVVPHTPPTQHEILAGILAALTRIEALLTPKPVVVAPPVIKPTPEWVAHARAMRRGQQSIADISRTLNQSSADVRKALAQPPESASAPPPSLEPASPTP